MKNKEIAAILFEMADLLEILEVQWKPVAYRKAARTIETLGQPIEDIYKHGGIKELKEIPGVGEGIAKKIEEYLKTGKIKAYKKLEKKIPKGVDKMMHIMGLGPKKAWKLYKKLKIKSLKDLERAAKQGKIRKIAGFGAKTEAEILEGVGMQRVKKARKSLLLGLETAREVEGILSKLNFVNKAEIGGSIRRMRETVADIDILVSSSQPKKVMDFVTSLPDVKKILAKGSTRASVIFTNQMQMDIRVLAPKSYGAALQYFTGNKDHNVQLRNIAIRKGYKLSEYGLFTKKSNKYIAGQTEAAVYKKLGLRYIEPELRENHGEIEAAKKGKLPSLVNYSDIKGDLHCHTNWSDGSNTMDQMVNAAKKMKYQYIAITDHSPSTVIANGLSEKRLLKHNAEVTKVQKKNPSIKVLKGSEVDIKKTGILDYRPAILKDLDIVIASVHAGFKMSSTDMTKRLLKAVNSGYITALGHPTGRRIGRRPSFDFNHEKVFQACADNDVLLEINSTPDRLDLNDNLIRTAKELKAKFLINTDSHSTDHFRFIELGIGQARRGWLEKNHVVNTLPKASFLKKIKR